MVNSNRTAKLCGVRSLLQLPVSLGKTALPLTYAVTTVVGTVVFSVDRATAPWDVNVGPPAAPEAALA